MFCAFTRSRYQVSVYRTICPLVLSYNVLNDRKLPEIPQSGHT